MNHAPMIQQPANYQPDQELFKLRKRLMDLIRLGAATPDTFQQALMQIWQETERRRIACLSEAEEHLRKYHALVSQAHAFTSQGSIAYAVIDGYVQLEEKRLREMSERAAEKRQQEEEQAAAAEEQKKAAVEEQKKAEAKKAAAEPAPVRTQMNGFQTREATKAVAAAMGTPKAKPAGGKRKKS
jgi:hypothetical protein